MAQPRSPPVMRRPAPSRTLDPDPPRPSLHPDPRRLRPSTSAAQQRPEPPRCETPRRPPRPAAPTAAELLSPAPTTPRAPELRRVQSSSALSVASSDGSGLGQASRLRAALEDAQYFAGGLLGRPSESTRHYTIIRHSHVLVWYRGPPTSVSMTVLADRPLPPGRKVWLQEKGFSGNAGMAARALVGSTGTWVDVTPDRQARPEDLRAVDERGIQRDLRRFAQKATGRARGHAPRETLVVRIPAAVADGYFRLVLGAGPDGKKALCGSPVFRVASTSPDAAVVRGASLATLPLELGVKAATTVGQQVAAKYLGLAGAVVQNRARALLAGRPALHRAGGAARAGSRGLGLADVVREGWQRGAPAPPGPFGVIGSDGGPEAPFPLRFEAKVVRGSGRAAAELGVPTANLAGVPDAVRTGLRGVFAAWARVLPAKGMPAKGMPAKGMPDKGPPDKGLPDVCDDWLEAVVTVAPPRGAAPGVAMASAVSVHLAHDFDGADFCGARLRVLLMGLLRAPLAAAEDDDAAGTHAHDVVTALASLGRESWAADEAEARLEAGGGPRSLPERLAEATGLVRHQVGRLPLHWAGVRSESGALRDRTYGNGGMWIVR